MRNKILLCTILLAMSCIVFSCKKDNNVDNIATKSEKITTIETKEIITTVVKENTELKGQLYTKEQVREAKKVATDYYKNFVHKVKDLKFKSIEGERAIFQIYDETNEATRLIYLKLENGKWKVIDEGYWC